MSRKTDLSPLETFVGLLGTVALMTLTIGIYGLVWTYDGFGHWARLILTSVWTLTLVVLYALVEND